MKSDNGAIPVRGCWVFHNDFGRGVVFNSKGTILEVHWNDTKYMNMTVPLDSVQVGFMAGMEVRHIPKSKFDKSLGEGVVLKTRVIAGFGQVLTRFFNSGQSRWLPYENLAWIKGVKHRFCTNDFGDETSPERFRLKILAHAIDNWNENTGSLSRLDIDPLPHQVHLVHHILASGHLNWLIADDVGLGKTIETGMLLKALEQRGQAERVLLITPAGLTNQWKEELHDKFGLSNFRIYSDNFNIEEEREWGMYKHVIGSIDKFKEERHLEKLLRADNWDIVIFDEAHRLSRRQYGLKYEVSHRFQLANLLRSKTKGMILLSATPHQGKPDKFQSLLMLLNPERKAEIEKLALNPEILSEMMIRNNKSDVTDLQGNFIFKGKTTKAIRVPHDDSMRTFDKSLQSYLKKGYLSAKELGQTGNAIGFVMTVYRKLAASSAKAINVALKNRKLRLIKESATILNSKEPIIEDERYKGESEELLILHSQNREFFDGELEELDTLITESEEVLKDDPKINEFIDTLLPTILAKNKNEKILIFTEYKSTQDYLKQALECHFGTGLVGMINGSMRHLERRQAIRIFENEGQFLISTEAGGEGINLQNKCHIMVNYDLPWNPMRLVQRIGRLYRYGQKYRVIVLNLYSPESMDDQIMELMQDRIEQVVGDLSSVSGEFNERLGEDILGEIADLLDVETILSEAISEGITRTRERIEAALNKAKRATSMQRELFDYAAGFNPNGIREELNITSEHVMSFTSGMFSCLGVEILEKSHKELIWRIKLPEKMTSQLGVSKTRWEITFDRTLHTTRGNCEMMDLDNFIFKFLLDKAMSYDFGGLATSVISNSKVHGAIICTYLRWQNSLGIRQRQELVALHVHQDQNVDINPQAFCDWLKSEVSNFENSNSISTENIFNQSEVVSSKILQSKSSSRLHPEGVYPLAAALFKSHAFE